MERIDFLGPPSSVIKLAGILQRGCKLRINLGRTIEQVLLEDLKLDPETIESKVQTVFLNGIAVDNLQAALVADKAVLALSSAMPGLVGASFRRAGFYAPLRMSIPSQRQKIPENKNEGMITLKLFNLLTGELGPHLLADGILLDRSLLLEFFSSQDAKFWHHSNIRLNQNSVTPEELLEQLKQSNQDFVFVKARVESSPAG